MRTSARRTAFTVFSALAATALFTAPAAATVYNQAVSVQEHAEIAEDGALTLRGTYHCEGPGALQIKVTVQQEDAGNLSVGTGSLVCDGADNEWTVRAPQFGAGLHPGHAVATAELQEVHLHGLMPSGVSTLAVDTQDIEIHERS
ncbi:DUF6299 family protein [Streptomyces sp. NBC_00249]|uniref:DUF6299 family protein n=1 Tax=Streptomyces sp. NBC_00249 TaxID=2975690 RepID=UPI00224E16B4|nr:DUF6299 family protein [Streptomyces sp. NBC_00249]MCX5199006.1 DUF6299 family protein [Streptomyces sp. NBC_00249]